MDGVLFTHREKSPRTSYDTRLSRCDAVEQNNIASLAGNQTPVFWPEA
jgi:hypothetical protein